MNRVRIQKKSTGAIWSSAMPSLGVWTKEFCGSKVQRTQRNGKIAMNFFPFTNPKWKDKWEVLS